MGVELGAAEPEFAVGRWQRLPLYRLGMASWFGVSACTGAAPLYPDMAAAVGTTAATLGLLITMSSGATALLQIPCGVIADRGRTRGLTILGLALAIGALLVWASAPNVICLGCGWLAFGAALPALQAGSLTAVLQQLPDEVRGTAMSRIWASASAGSAFSLILFGVVGQHASWRTALALGSAIPALALSAVWRSPPFPVAIAAGGTGYWAPVVRVVTHPPLRRIALVATLAAGVAVSTPVAASFILHHHSVDTSTASVVLLVFILGGVVGAPLVGASSDRWGPAKTLSGLLVCTTVVLAALSWRWPGTFAFAFGLGLTGAAVNGTMAVSLGLAASAAQSLGGVGVGTALASLRVLQFGGATLAPALSGFLLERSDGAAELGLALLLGATAGAAFLLVPRRLGAPERVMS